MGKRTASQHQTEMDRSTLRGALFTIRQRLRTLRTERRVELKRLRAECKAHRVTLRERRKAALAKLAADFKAERNAGRAECRARYQQALTQAKTEAAKQRARRQLARDQFALSRRMSGRAGTRGPSKVRETRDESDGAVEYELETLDPALVAVWRENKHRVPNKARSSRAEAFLEWAQDNAEEVASAQARAGDAAGEQLARDAQAMQKALAKLPHGRDGWKRLAASQSKWSKTARGQSPVEAALDALDKWGMHLSPDQREAASVAIDDALVESVEPSNELAARRLRDLGDRLSERRLPDALATAVPF